MAEDGLFHFTEDGLFHFTEDGLFHFTGDGLFHFTEDGLFHFTEDGLFHFTEVGLCSWALCVIGYLVMLLWPVLVVGVLAVVSGVTGAMKWLDGPLFAWFDHARTPLNTSLFFFAFAGLLAVATYHIALGRCNRCSHPLLSQDVGEHNECDTPGDVVSARADEVATGAEDERER